MFSFISISATYTVKSSYDEPHQKIFEIGGHLFSDKVVPYAQYANAISWLILYLNVVINGIWFIIDLLPVIWRPFWQPSWNLENGGPFGGRLENGGHFEETKWVQIQNQLKFFKLQLCLILLLSKSEQFYQIHAPYGLAIVDTSIVLFHCTFFLLPRKMLVNLLFRIHRCIKLYTDHQTLFSLKYTNATIFRKWMKKMAFQFIHTIYFCQNYLDNVLLRISSWTMFNIRALKWMSISKRRFCVNAHTWLIKHTKSVV